MNQEKLKAVRAAIVKAVPEISMCVRCEKTTPIHSDFCSDGLAHLIQNRTIRLADVLLAMKARTIPITNAAWRTFKIDTIELLCHYRLSNDDITKQSPEFIDFVYDLLNV